MPIELDETVGGDSANTYHTLETADAFFATRFGASLWNEEDEERKKAALVEAARSLSRLRYKGRRNNPAQALPFPRAYPYNGDPERRGLGLAEIPTAILEAQALEALALLQRDADGGGAPSRQDLQAQGVKSFTVGNLTETFADGVVSTGDVRMASPEARQLLTPWVSVTGRVTSRRRCNGYVVANRWDEDECL